MRLETAEYGLQAVEMTERNAFDLILMDMQMPYMDGLEASQRIRRLLGYESTPIIAMTANAFVEDRMPCMTAGINAFPAKPVMPTHLCSAIVISLN
jgi:CheY-like chemotaxis protein